METNILGHPGLDGRILNWIKEKGSERVKWLLDLSHAGDEWDFFTSLTSCTM
jgi:hypothetical protein